MVPFSQAALDCLRFVQSAHGLAGGLRVSSGWSNSSIRSDPRRRPRTVRVAGGSAAVEDRLVAADVGGLHGAAAALVIGGPRHGAVH